MSSTIGRLQQKYWLVHVALHVGRIVRLVLIHLTTALHQVSITFTYLITFPNNVISVRGILCLSELVKFDNWISLNTPRGEPPTDFLFLRFFRERIPKWPFPAV